MAPVNAVRRIRHQGVEEIRVGPTLSAGVTVGPWVLSPDHADALAERLRLAAAEARRSARLRDGLVHVRVVRRDGTDAGAGFDARVTGRDRSLVCVELEGSPQWFDLRTGAPVRSDARRHQRLLDPGDREALFSLEQPIP